ncbi:helix-turn-helix transcriptional regulator [Streptomyces sp. HNM0574]|uniref:helix-turn-helix domain-containing protein n=1 Tax=Streptomyces sp. HNM0574 TaxID=2714954 RepID=UPI00146D3C35|nr:helix-turn-helix transcriptional regulator [Streptomyces sp. HNM0574]NLU65957.1 helix-turn-helix domain-containing protein [Streptomyces sp. HNM0574]
MADHQSPGSSSEPEPSDSLKGFGEVVKGFRELAGMTREELAPKVCCSKHTIASIELGRRFPPPHFPQRADHALGASGIITRAATHLSRNPGLASWFQMWADLEQEALTLQIYECRLVPGLLQSTEYARAVYRNRVPSLCDEDIEAKTTSRMERQQLLHRNANSDFSFILEEALFLRHTGGKEVTGGLIGHILALTELRNVEVQIMPLMQPSHAALEGPIQLLETQEHRCMAYSEGQRRGQLITDADDLSVLQRRYARMRAQALTPVESRSLLKQIRGAL